MFTMIISFFIGFILCCHFYSQSGRPTAAVIPTSTFTSPTTQPFFHADLISMKNEFSLFIHIFLFIWIITLCQSYQYIITFQEKLSISQHEQYFLDNNTCFMNENFLLYYSWNIPNRSYLISNSSTEYCIIKINKRNNDENIQLMNQCLNTLLTCLHHDPFIKSIDKDSLCNRNLMQNNYNHYDYQNHSSFIPSVLTAKYNQLGYRGKNIKIAIFDTGLSTNHPYFKTYERYDWTNEEFIEDDIGHGTFVAGIIGNTSPDCVGMAPEATIYIFRIFTKNQKSYTSWFLDAFNYAIFLKVDIINLSIGGPDHNDIPFRKKIDEMAESGIIIISAMGNTGPIWGTANSPADQNSVLGVGGWFRNSQISSFSSRGMSVWEIPHGIGRFKPDIVAPSVNLVSISSSYPYQCYQLSGTSVATPVVTGATAVILSSLPSRRDHASGSSIRLFREDISNIAAIKQIYLDSSFKLQNELNRFDSTLNPTIFEQGAGLIDVDHAIEYLERFRPHVSFWPPRLSNHMSDCPYLWPFCDSNLFQTSQPLLMNLTILNSIVATSGIYRIEYVETTDKFGESFDGISFSLQRDKSKHHRVTLRGNVLVVKADFEDIIWPWSGFMGLSVSLNNYLTNYQGNVSGLLTIYVGDVMIHSSNSKMFMKYSDWNEDQKASFQLDINVISPPHRKQRILWDIYHSLSYPSPFVPNDTPTDIRYDTIVVISFTI